MTITPPVGHYVDDATREIVRNDGAIRYSLMDLWKHSQAGTGPYDPNSYYAEPIPEIDNGRTYWRYRNGGYVKTDENGHSYGRCGTKEDAERIILGQNSKNT